MRALALAFALLAAPSLALAAEPHATLSANLVAAAALTADARAELALDRALGLQLGAAYGFVSPLPGLTPPRVASLSAQIRRYVAGEFAEGLAMGVELTGARLLGPPAGRYGVALAARVAYKVGSARGFCAEVQVGGGPVLAFGYAPGEASWVGHVSVQGTVALLVGWSL